MPTSSTTSFSRGAYWQALTPWSRARPSDIYELIFRFIINKQNSIKIHYTFHQLLSVNSCQPPIYFFSFWWLRNPKRQKDPINFLIFFPLHLLMSVFLAPTMFQGPWWILGIQRCLRQGAAQWLVMTEWLESFYIDSDSRTQRKPGHFQKAGSTWAESQTGEEHLEGKTGPVTRLWLSNFTVSSRCQPTPGDISTFATCVSKDFHILFPALAILTLKITLRGWRRIAGQSPHPCLAFGYSFLWCFFLGATGGGSRFCGQN